MQQQQVTNESEDQVALDGAALQQKITAADPGELDLILRETIRSQAAAILDHITVEDDTNFLENGLTSLKALELTRNLMSLTDIEIPLVAVIEHSTPAELARFMAETFTENAGE
jgi:acyl carrier protein